MSGKVISLSRGMGSNRRRLFALVDHGWDTTRPGATYEGPRFGLWACDPEDDGEAWVAVRGPQVNAEFIRLAALAGWNTELAKLAPAPLVEPEWVKSDGS